jgi:hypothetical protein
VVVTLLDLRLKGACDNTSCYVLGQYCHYLVTSEEGVALLPPCGLWSLINDNFQEYIARIKYALRFIQITTLFACMLLQYRQDIITVPAVLYSSD